MKTLNQIHRKVIVILFTIGLSTQAYSQEEKTSKGLEFEYISITPIEIYFNKDYGGVAITSTFGFSLNDHLFSLNGSIGGEIGILGVGSTFYQLNLLYGREFKFNRVIHLDMHVGAGIYGFNDHKDTRLTTLGIPLITKLRFKTGDRFSLGLKFQGNINSIENILAIGLVLQWNSIK